MSDETYSVVAFFSILASAATLWFKWRRGRALRSWRSFSKPNGPGNRATGKTGQPDDSRRA